MLPDLPPEPPNDPPPLVLKMSRELARSSFLPGQHTPPTAQCVIREAERNELDPLVLLTVMKVESGKPGELMLNRNGTFDLGPMSINTVWLPQLAKRFGTNEKDLRQRLASDGCSNVAAAAWILKRKIVQTGSLWEGVAHYHSSNPIRQVPYLEKVQWHFSRIVARFAGTLR